MATLRSSFPVNFELLDANEEQVLFITDDVSGQRLFLEVTNTSSEPISPLALSGAASAENYHLALDFRPGSIFNNPCAVQLESTHFEMFVNKDNDGKIIPNGDGTFSLYFKATNNWTLQEGEKVVLELSQIRAEAANGTRSTKAQLRYDNLLHTGNSEPFAGFRTTHLNIVNHRGRRRIPLHVGFLTSGTVLNDNLTPNTLLLRVTNVSRDNNTLETQAESRLRLDFDSGPLSKEYALATDANTANFTVKSTAPGQPQIEITKATGANEWLIPFPGLAPDEFVEIEVSNVVTGHPTGHTNLYIAHENIPGYWDSQHVAIIDKGPIEVRGHKVGVGTLPEGKLHVVNQNQDGNGDTLIIGPTNQSNLRLGYHQDYSWIQSQHSKPLAINPKGNPVWIGSTEQGSDVHIQTRSNSNGVVVMSPTAGNTHLPYSDNWNYISGKGVRFRNPGMANIITMDLEAIRMGIGTESLSGKLTVQATSNEGGVGILSPTAGNTHLPHSNNWNYIAGKGVVFRSDHNHEKIRMDLVSGEMGIGTNNPEAKLHVIGANEDPNGGSLRIGPRSQANLRLGHNTTYSWIQSHGSRPLSINAIGNNVGVGTNTPSAKLDVNGNLRTKALNVNSAQQFNKIQAGHHRCGSHGGGVKEVRINFPQHFVNQPMCQVTVRNVGYYNDTFAVTVKYIDRTHFKVNIQRSDSHNAGWGQDVRIDWFAYEINGMTSQ